MAEPELYEIGLQLGAILKRLEKVVGAVQSRIDELVQGVKDSTKGGS